MIIMVKISGSQMGSPAAAEEEGEVRGGGRGGSRERRELRSKSTLESAEIKVENRRAHECSTGDFSDCQGNHRRLATSTLLSSVIIALARTSACPSAA